VEEEEKWRSPEEERSSPEEVAEWRRGGRISGGEEEKWRSG
jgi:hypothetical protein